MTMESTYPPLPAALIFVSASEDMWSNIEGADIVPHYFRKTQATGMKMEAEHAAFSRQI
jgi:hypothetical protein